DQLRTPCWCPNPRRARRRRVSNPDCAADARPHSHLEQHPLPVVPSLIGRESPLHARSLASCFWAKPGERLTCEAITNSRLCDDQRWSRRVRLNLLTQMRDINTQVLPMLLGLRPPDFAEDVAMRENASGMFHK